MQGVPGDAPLGRRSPLSSLSQSSTLPYDSSPQRSSSRPPRRRPPSPGSEMVTLEEFLQETNTPPAPAVSERRPQPSRARPRLEKVRNPTLRTGHMNQRFHNPGLQTSGLLPAGDGEQEGVCGEGIIQTQNAFPSCAGGGARAIRWMDGWMLCHCKYIEILFCSCPQMHSLFTIK